MSNKNVQKPITVARADFISDLTNLVNNSGLPSFILEPIFKDMFNDMKIMSQRQLESDRKQYEQVLEQLGEKGD